MDSTTRLILPEVREALESDPAALAELTEEMLPADLADLAEQLDPDHAHRLLAALPIEAVARLLEQCDDEHRRELFAHLAAHDLATAAAVTDEMAPDDRADLYAELPEELRKQLLAEVDPEESRDIRTLLAYDEDTAGGVMTTDFVALPATMTVEQAIDAVRKTAEEMETIYVVYVVDSHGTLHGVVSLRDLVTSPAHKTLEDIMNPNVVTVDVDTDQEEVAHVMAKYDLLAVPVVDRTHRLVGMITVDDILDVVEAEATEDAHRLGAVEPIEQPYMATPVWTIVRARVPWLIALFLVQFVSGPLLQHFTASVASATILMWFVPMIMSAGGNAGSQSATLVIRAMSLGETGPKHALKILSREVLIGATLGIILGFVGMVRVATWNAARSVEMALAIGCAVTAVIVFGALIGAGIPLLLERLKIDPAVSSTPFVASLVDVGGLVLFFEIARLFVG
ncbi:MAG: magnesium transporter [Deltaproteobacteria bacterium]|nr:MAG: magnesium transporter [Deltaproteobacteria bacterium]